MEITIINLRSERLCERFDEEAFEELEISGLSRPLQKNNIKFARKSRLFRRHGKGLCCRFGAVTVHM